MQWAAVRTNSELKIISGVLKRMSNILTIGYQCASAEIMKLVVQIGHPGMGSDLSITAADDSRSVKGRHSPNSAIWLQKSRFSKAAKPLAY